MLSVRFWKPFAAIAAVLFWAACLTAPYSVRAAGLPDAEAAAKQVAAAQPLTGAAQGDDCQSRQQVFYKRFHIQPVKVIIFLQTSQFGGYE